MEKQISTSELERRSLLCDKVDRRYKILDQITNLCYKLKNNFFWFSVCFMQNKYSLLFFFLAGFSYNTPEHSNCNPLLLPEHGRLVCTNEKGLSRTMCLAECMQGYEPTQEFHIFFCSKKGIWSNLYQQVVPPPTLGCVKTKSKQID